MLQRPDDWRTAYVRALAAESGDRARERAMRAKALWWGAGIGLAVSALMWIAGLV